MRPFRTRAYHTGPADPQVLRRRFHEKQEWFRSLHNSAGRTVVLREPTDAELLAHASTSRGLEALALSFTRPVYEHSV